MTWRLLRSYLDGLRWEITSAYWRARDPENEGLWGVDAYLLAEVVDALNIANWQRTKDGSTGSNPPERFPRPSDKRLAQERASAIEEIIRRRKRRQSKG